eukprot:COSAG06_NODE_1410_length_9546_cov_102.602519_6_plen_76_part_00
MRACEALRSDQHGRPTASGRDLPGRASLTGARSPCSTHAKPRGTAPSFAATMNQIPEIAPGSGALDPAAEALARS